MPNTNIKDLARVISWADHTVEDISRQCYHAYRPHTVILGLGKCAVSGIKQGLPLFNPTLSAAPPLNTLNSLLPKYANTFRVVSEARLLYYAYEREFTRTVQLLKEAVQGLQECRTTAGLNLALSTILSHMLNLVFIPGCALTEHSPSCVLYQHTRGLCVRIADLSRAAIPDALGIQVQTSTSTTS